MKRLTLFLKGNLDVFDSLHSCTIGGIVQWNGVNEIARAGYPGTLLRLKHETWPRSDALLAADGTVPAALLTRQLPLGTHPAISQFSQALFTAPADAYVLTIQPDIATRLVRHRRDGFLLYPHGAAKWCAADRAWLQAEFDPTGPLDPAASMRNLQTIVNMLRSRSDAPILVYNVSAVMPRETVHRRAGFGETCAMRCQRFNLALAEFAAHEDVSIIDVDALLARCGVDRLKLDMFHFVPEAQRLIAEEVVRVLADHGLFETAGVAACAPAL